MMTEEVHGLFNKFLKKKPPILPSIESEDAYEFLINCNERLHKFGLVERYSVKFASFQFWRDEKI